MIAAGTSLAETDAPKRDNILRRRQTGLTLAKLLADAALDGIAQHGCARVLPLPIIMPRRGRTGGGAMLVAAVIAATGLAPSVRR